MTGEYWYSHKPVLLAEVMEYLNCRKGSTIVDCTLGGAGHAQEIAARIAPGGTLVGLDVDDEALNAARKALAPFGQQINVEVVRASFAELDDVLTELGTGPVDGFLFDLGISSHHVERADRGFSYQKEGPLDMRMDRRSEITAEYVINNYTQEQLERIFRDYGEEKFARRIARFIVERRQRKPVKTTGELVEIIKDAIPASARRAGRHPARRVFQALRIEVNRELENLNRGLTSAVSWLKPGGRVVVISYHSLEDRLVKSIFKDFESTCICPPTAPACVCGRKPVLKILTRRAVSPSPAEIEENPRARSARLRAAEKLQVIQ